MGRPLAARAPNHLGDGVIALPALMALAEVGPLTVYAPRWGAELYQAVPAEIRPLGRIRADTAVLFAPSLRAALEARGARRVVGCPTDFRRLLLTDVVPVAATRAQTYANLARAVGAAPTGDPCYTPRGTCHAPPHVGLNPLCRGGPPRLWPHFLALAKRLERPIRFYAGPGEDRAIRPYAAFPTLVGLSLPDLAATLQRCELFITGDTGPAHFARAVGCPTKVIQLSTDARTAPPGATLIRANVPCSPCYRNSCERSLVCAELPPQDVL